MVPPGFKVVVALAADTVVSPWRAKIGNKVLTKSRALAPIFVDFLSKFFIFPIVVFTFVNHAI